MNTAPFLRYRLQIEPLTPIHVGSGQTIEPYEYDLAEDDQFCWLVILDLGAILADMPPAERTRFEEFSLRGDFPALRRWLREHADHSRHARWRVPVDEDAYKEIRRNINNPDRLGEIHLFTRDAATGRPYLPGSSIKGAIRTAIVDAVARQPDQRVGQLEAVAREWDRARQGGVRFEAAALEYAKRDGRPDLYRDPLRQIAVSDASLPQDACWIDRIQIIRPQGQSVPDPRGIVIYRDLVVPPQDPGTPVAVTELRLHHLLGDRRRMGRDVLPRSLDAAEICRWCNAFYRPRLERELGRFVQDAGLAEQLRAAASGMKENQCLIRLGRHSHFECVTVGEPFHRSPRRGFGKSRSYVGGRQPLGWLRIGLESVGPP